MKHFGAGIVVGMLLGSVIGLLVAPQRGSSTRQRVKEVAHAAGDKVTHTFDFHKAKAEPGDYIRQAI